MSPLSARTLTIAGCDQTLVASRAIGSTTSVSRHVWSGNELEVATLLEGTPGRGGTVFSLSSLSTVRAARLQESVIIGT
jgi:hypothetical protein